MVKYKFESEEEKRLFVKSEEDALELRLDLAVDAIKKSDKRIVTLCGPSCSGKTTASAKIVMDLTEIGKTVHVISIDDYYLPRKILIKRAKEEGRALDFDSADSIDIKKLEKTVKEILAGNSPLVPRYDFLIGEPVETVKYKRSENDVFLFEGIQAMYPEVVALFPKDSYVSVFVSVENGVSLDGVTFSQEEVRFLRRLVRDYSYRGSSPEFTFGIWKSVRDNEDKNIIPYRSTADVKINTFLGYELSMIKPYAVALLKTISKNSEYYNKAQDIIKKTECIEPISAKYMPQRSLYREFLGKETS